MNINININTNTKLFHIYSCFKIHKLGMAQQPTNDFQGAILKKLGIE